MEFNARFGDPETQPLLALLDSPLSPLLVGAATGTLASVPPPVWKPGAAVAVVMASAGYPESASKGDVIVGTETLDKESDVHVLHSGTALDPDGRLVTAGGRVLAVTAVGSDVADARAKAYEGVVLHLLPRRPVAPRHRGRHLTSIVGRAPSDRPDVSTTSRQRRTWETSSRDGPQRAGDPVRR